MWTSAWRRSGPEEVGSQAWAWWPQGGGDLWTLLLTVGLLFDPVHRCGLRWNGSQSCKPGAIAAFIPIIGTCPSTVSIVLANGH